MIAVMGPGAMAVTLLVCVLASWGLRVLLISVLPPERLPERLRDPGQTTTDTEKRNPRWPPS